MNKLEKNYKELVRDMKKIYSEINYLDSNNIEIRYNDDDMVLISGRRLNELYQLVFNSLESKGLSFPSD
ncbi:MAG: hypothetical protein GQ540_03425 [Lutibacter sp.]|uniref:hypothetical protein n=1 Tax=Lutibacter sp. TaxID=1925666 RepID=UPI0019F3E4DB|nr:hypothetical protein [Lutibacter sp.]NOR27563.1 hypothetical protein [Lutibacter sp.]